MWAWDKLTSVSLQMSGYNVETRVDGGCASFGRQYPRMTPQLYRCKFVCASLVSQTSAHCSFMICGDQYDSVRCGNATQQLIAKGEVRFFVTGFSGEVGRGCNSDRGCLPASAAQRKRLRAGVVACWQEAHCGFCAAAAVQGVHVAHEGSDPGLQALEIVR